MPDPSDQRHIDALVKLGERDADPQVRLAALAAATGAEAATVDTIKRLTCYLMKANLYEKRPEYVVFAGLVFQPLDRNLLSTLNLTDDNVRYFFNYFGPRELSKERSQPVILTQVLPDAINTHFDGVGGKMVDTINGQKITRMSDLTSALEKAEGEFIKITLVGEGRPLVLDRARAAAAGETVYRIGVIDTRREGEAQTIID